MITSVTCFLEIFRKWYRNPSSTGSDKVVKMLKIKFRTSLVTFTKKKKGTIHYKTPEAVLSGRLYTSMRISPPEYALVPEINPSIPLLCGVVW